MVSLVIGVSLGHAVSHVEMVLRQGNVNVTTQHHSTVELNVRGKPRKRELVKKNHAQVC